MESPAASAAGAALGRWPLSRGRWAEAGSPMKGGRPPPPRRLGQEPPGPWGLLRGADAPCPGLPGRGWRFLGCARGQQHQGLPGRPPSVLAWSGAVASSRGAAVSCPRSSGTQRETSCDRPRLLPGAFRLGKPDSAAKPLGHRAWPAGGRTETAAGCAQGTSGHGGGGAASISALKVTWAGRRPPCLVRCPLGRWQWPGVGTGTPRLALADSGRAPRGPTSRCL